MSDDDKNYITVDILKGIYEGLTDIGYSYDISHNGNYYTVETILPEKKIFCISPHFPEGICFKYNSFDEMLDNFMVEDKKLREVIFDMIVENEW
jgi:hypothetical protein